VWKQRSRNQRPQFPHTDIIGALFLASELFKQTPGRENALVMFSDMRNSASGVDRERTAVAPRCSDVLKNNKNISELKRVQVYALGVGGAGKSLIYWQSLREFWAEISEWLALTRKFIQDFAIRPFLLRSNNGNSCLTEHKYQW
jgi:hypothetical protein